MVAGLHSEIELAGCLSRISASISGASAGLGCQAEWQRVEVGLIRGASVKTRMRSSTVYDIVPEIIEGRHVGVPLPK